MYLFCALDISCSVLYKHVYNKLQYFKTCYKVLWWQHCNLLRPNTCSSFISQRHTRSLPALTLWINRAQPPLSPLCLPTLLYGLLYHHRIKQNKNTLECLPSDLLFKSNVLFTVKCTVYRHIYCLQSNVMFTHKSTIYSQMYCLQSNLLFTVKCTVYSHIYCLQSNLLFTHKSTIYSQI
jgi:hypothetical protein